MLKRLGEVIGSTAQLVQQSRVFNRDDGLGGKVLQQLDLLVGEQSNVLTINGDDTDQLVLLEHWREEKGPSPSDSSNWFVGVFYGNIGNVCDPLRLGDAVKNAGEIAGRHGITVSFCGPSRWSIMQRDMPKHVSIIEQQVAKTCVADVHRVLQHSVKNGLKLAS